MRIVEAQVDVQAPPEAIWQTLTHTDTYPLWHPLLRRCEGNLADGQELWLWLVRFPRAIHVQILRWQPNQEWTWRGTLPPFGLTWRHEHYLQALDASRSRFICRGSFRGVLLDPAWPVLRRLIQPRYLAFALALKARVESAAF